MGTTIRVRCTDQVLTFENTPVIASGGREVDSVHFEFCGKWEGSVRTAVFWRSPTEAYHVLLDDSDTCAIPREVLQADGLIFFGVFGVYPDGRQRPTEVLTYRVVKGTITEGTKPTDPAPDIYTQLQAAYADALAKMAAYQANTERLMAEHLAEMEQTVEGYHDDNAKYMAAHEQAVAAAMAQHEQTVAQQMTQHEQAVAQQMTAHEQAVNATIGNVVTAAEQAAAAANAATAAAGTKADKVKNATAGNFAGLDANGNLTDSGKKPSDFASKESVAKLATKTEIFTQDGVFTVPNGVTSVHVMCYGGGGGGSRNASYGAGGGGGYYAEADIEITEAVFNVPVTIGAGGAKLTANGSGNNGGATSFGEFLIADGGGGGGKNALGAYSYMSGGDGGSGGGGGCYASTSKASSYIAPGGAGANFGGGGSAGWCSVDRVYITKSHTGVLGGTGGSMGGAGGDGGGGGYYGSQTADFVFPNTSGAPGKVGIDTRGLDVSAFAKGEGLAGSAGVGVNFRYSAGYCHAAGGGGGGGGGYGGNGGNGTDAIANSTPNDNIAGGGGGGGGGYGGNGGNGITKPVYGLDSYVGGSGGGGGGYGKGSNGGNGSYSETVDGTGYGSGGGGYGGAGAPGICIVTYTLPV